MKQFNLLKISSTLFILSLIFHQFSFLEIIKNVNIRISEIIFLIVSTIFLFYFLNKKINITFSKCDFYLILFPILGILHLLIFNDYSSVIAVIFFVYCFLIYFIFKNFFLNFGIEFISKTIIFSALIASIIAIFGWILIQLKIESVLVLTYEYPIFIGEPGRSRALFETPNSLFIFLVFPILLLIHDLKNTKNLIFLLVILFGGFVTFSKSNVLLISLILIYITNLYKLKFRFNIFLILTSFFLIFIYIFFSHFILLNKNSENFKSYTSTAFVSKNFVSVFEYKDYVLIPTNYVETKKKSLELFKNKPLLGNGFYSFQKFKSKNVNNEKVKPHSTYFGYLAEFGLIGLFLVIGVFIYFTSVNWKINKTKYYLLLFSIYIIFESFNADLMTSRIIWIFFAYVEFTSINYKNNEAKKLHPFR